MGKSKTNTGFKKHFNRFAVYARRADEKNFSDWTRVSNEEKAFEHAEKVRELGFKAKIYDSEQKKVILKDEVHCEN